MHRYYYICRRNLGRPARIHMVDGRILIGRIRNVTPHYCHLSPFGGSISTDADKMQGHVAMDTSFVNKGNEIYYYGPRRPRFSPVVPLAAIAGITFIGLASFGAPYW